MFMKKQVRSFLNDLNATSSGEWNFHDTGGGFGSLVWEGANSHIAFTSNEDECMAPTTWDHELLVGHYVGGTYEATEIVDSGVFEVKGREKFFNLVEPIIQQDCKQDGGHTNTGRGVCADCGTFLD